MPLVSHYGDVPDISDRVVYPTLVFSIVTPMFVVVRLVSRHVFTDRIGADDWVILASMITGEILSVSWIILCTWGFGKHREDVPERVMVKSMKLFLSAQILYKLNIGLTKISILLLFIRLFLYSWFRIMCWIGIGLAIAFTTGTITASIIQCMPLESAFTDVRLGRCIDLGAFWYTNGIFNIGSDVLLVILPILVIRKLTLSNKRKIAVCGVFGLGFVTCIASVFRLTTLNMATSHRDISWDGMSYIMWTVIESNLDIICACLATLRQFLTTCLRGMSRVFSTYSPGEGNTPIQKEKPENPVRLGNVDRQRNCWVKEMSPIKAERCDGRGSIEQHLGPFNERSIMRTTQSVVKYDASDEIESKKGKGKETQWCK